MTFINILPSFIRRKIAHRLGLIKILDNLGWLFFDKVLRLGVGLLVGVWIARYLGPTQFGKLSYALAFVGLFSVLAGMGLNSVVVRDILRVPEEANTTLGTSFALQILGSVIAAALIVVTLAWLQPNDSLIKTIIYILSLSLVFKSADVVKYWFESQVQSRYTVWIENGSFIIMAGIKVAMILMQFTLMAFVWAIIAEGALVAIGLLGIYAKYGGHLSKWRLTIERAKTLLKDSWPLVLSSIAIVVYMRIDQVMLGEMLGDEEVGLYNAAQRVSEIWYFIPITITASVFPAVISAKKLGDIYYYGKLQKLFNFIVIPAVLMSLPMTILSTPIIELLYGDPYSSAGSILAIHVWTGVFVSLGVASSSWFVIENLQKYAFYRTLLGAICNIAGNLILIPKYGGVGAAISTLLSQVVATYLADIVSSKTRHLFYMKSISLLPMLRYIWKNNHAKSIN